MSTLPQSAEPVSETLPDWRRQASERLSAHRTRRGAFPGTPEGRQPALPGLETESAPAAKAARVAARVAERYAKAPSYSEALAAEAAKAARAAEAAAEAARAAQAAAEAVTDVLWAGLEAEEAAAETKTPVQASLPIEPLPAASPAPVADPAHYRIDPRSLPAARPETPVRSSRFVTENHPSVEPHPHVVDPFEDAVVAPAQPLPARVLEFPRELVAARKARPRLAEGPLREEVEREATQLRIFEVEPDAISHEPLVQAAAPVEPAALPEWSTIRLDATPRSVAADAGEQMRAAGGHAGRQAAPLSSRAGRHAAPQGARRSVFDDMLPLHVAPIEDRLMAAIVDAALTLCAFLMFVLVFVACTPHPPEGKGAIVAAGGVLIGFVALYQWLFFTFADATPGMRYARIALCTFEDENPARRTLQYRVGACFLAILPMGLGFLWTLLDDDRLGWHDRMTRTYQRSYR